MEFDCGIIRAELNITILKSIIFSNFLTIPEQVIASTFYTYKYGL